MNSWCRRGEAWPRLEWKLANWSRCRRWTMTASRADLSCPWFAWFLWRVTLSRARSWTSCCRLAGCTSAAKKEGARQLVLEQKGHRCLYLLVKAKERNWWMRSSSSSYSSGFGSQAMCCRKRSRCAGNESMSQGQGSMHMVTTLGRSSRVFLSRTASWKRRYACQGSEDWMCNYLARCLHPSVATSRNKFLYFSVHFCSLGSRCILRTLAG